MQTGQGSMQTGQDSRQPGPSVHVPGQDTNVRVVYVANPQPQPTEATGCCGQRRPGLRSGAVTALSIVQLVLGFVCIVSNCIDMGIGCYRMVIIYSAYGITGGIFFVLTGCFGLAAGQTRRGGWIKTLMIFSIISASVTASVISCASIELADASNLYSCGPSYNCNECAYDCHDYSGDYPYIKECSEQKASLSLASIQIVCAVGELVVAILTSVLCCSGLNCCCRNRSVQDQSSRVQATYIPGTTNPALIQAAGYTGQINPGYYQPNQTYIQPNPAGNSWLPPGYTEVQGQPLRSGEILQQKL